MTMNGTNTRTPTRIEKMQGRGDEAAEAGQQQRPDPHPEQVVQRGRDRDAVPLADVADEQHAARRRRRRQLAEHRELARVPGHDREHEQGDASRRRRRQGSAAAAAGLPPDAHRARSRSHRTVATSTASTSTPSLRDSVATPASSPARTKSRGWPRRPRAGQPQRARDQRLVEREVVGLDHVHERQGRERGQDAGADRRRTAARRRPGRSPRRAARRARRSARTAARRPSPSGRAAR